MPTPGTLSTSQSSYPCVAVAHAYTRRLMRQLLLIPPMCYTAVCPRPAAWAPQTGCPPSRTSVRWSSVAQLWQGAPRYASVRLPLIAYLQQLAP